MGDSDAPENVAPKMSLDLATSAWKRVAKNMIDTRRSRAEAAVIRPEDYKLAYFSILDAFDGRFEHGMANMSKKDPRIYRLFLLHISPWWLRLQVFACVLHSFMTFLDPCAKGEQQSLSEIMALKVAEFIILALYASDIAIKTAYMGFASYMTKQWQVVHISVVGVLILDWVISLVLPFRFTRPIRPLVMLCRHREVRRFYTAIIDMFPKVREVTIPILGLLYVFATFAHALFATDPAFQEDDHVHFRDFPSSLRNMFILLSMDNYSQVVHTLSLKSGYAASFFLLFIFVQVFFGMALLLAAITDEYTEQNKIQVRQDWRKEIKGLLKAFSYVDPLNSGVMSRSTWCNLMDHIRPESTKMEREVLFEMLSRYDNELDIIDFLSLRSVLEFKFSSQGIRKSSGAGNLVDRILCPAFLEGTLRSLIQHKFYPWIRTAMILFDIACLSSLSVSKMTIPFIFGSQLELEMISISFLVIEAWFTIVSKGGLVQGWGVMSSTQKLVILVTFMVTIRWTPAAIFFPIGFLNAFRAFRIFLLTDGMQFFFSSLLSILDILLSLAGFGFAFVYFFAVLGVELYVNFVSNDEDSQVESFNSWYAGFLIAGRLMVSADWSDVMHDLMKKTNPLLGWYFICFHIVIVVTILNLLTAMTIEFYRLHYVKATSKQYEATVDLATSHLSQEVDGARIANVLHVWFKPKTSWRQQLAGVEDLTEISEDDILCNQKATKVNLRERLDARKNKSESTNTEKADLGSILASLSSAASSSATASSKAHTTSST
eukprot:TRINITY_DN10279_c0_g3_i2.p1 TRINITY_DN10279_c0_g3~~TRINITY_DN10279_c0_g3_i2.p1  ORF type:complete len:773 (-),score=147.75 TRINITY_DN10279_c0_g3_i2:308-2626(-)